jgi:hypothetical protein
MAFVAQTLFFISNFSVDKDSFRRFVSCEEFR